jgi:predicted esterase
MMTTRSYEDFNAEVVRLYQAQAYAEVLDLLTREGGQYTVPEEAANILYFQSCMAARVGQPDRALDVLQEALDRGFWYGEQAMRLSPSWQPLQGLPRFEERVVVCRARAAVAYVGPQLVVEEPPGGCPADAPSPLFLALHGNGANARLTVDGWRPVVAAGWLLAVPQSSQVMGMDAFVWNDQDIARRELTEHYATLAARYTLDPAQTILAGFSMGGETALRAALDGTIPVRGFILLGPGGPTIDTPDAWLPLITGAAERGLRGYVLLGEADAGVPHDAIRAIVDLLNTHGIPCELEMLPGLQHEYPPDFAPHLARALAFIQPPA